MSYTTRRCVWHLALLDDFDPGSDCPATAALLVVRPEGARVIGLGDFGARCPYGAASAWLRARLSRRGTGGRPGAIHTHDARLARRLSRAARPAGTTVRLRPVCPALDEARAALPGGTRRWRWSRAAERPAPTS